MVNSAKLIPGLSEALGQSDVFLAFQERLSLVAAVDRPVLLVGERGTGKELAAVRLHYHSRRWQGPFMAVNCSALAETLLESELFGHEPGAFTGAFRLRRGRFEAAHEGTLFLDEAGGISLPVQEKLLRAVEYKVFERVGASKTISVDARIIAATNADLRALAAQGRFKADLLDRLSFEVLHVPPLRARTGDVAFLADHFAGRMAMELGLPDKPRFTARARQALESHEWPGNVRELKNVVERAVFRAQGGMIKEVVLDPFDNPFGLANARGVPCQPWMSGTRPQDSRRETASLPLSLQEAVASLERGYLEQALGQARFNQRKAAELLGLSYHQFRGLYRKHSGEFEK